MLTGCFDKPLKRLKKLFCFSNPRLKSLCENKEIALTHDFNRGNFDKKRTMFLTVSTVFTIFT